MFKKTRSQVMFVECFGSPCKVIVYNNIGLTRQFFPNIQKNSKSIGIYHHTLKKRTLDHEGVELATAMVAIWIWFFLLTFGILGTGMMAGVREAVFFGMTQFPFESY